MDPGVPVLLDARTFATDETRAYDLCIVGAGAAGITLALALADRGLRIALLESGGIEEDADTSDLLNGAMTGIRTWNPRTQRARYLGGTTNRWAGWCRPLSRDDFEERAHVPHSGWPISFDDLEPWYRRAHERVELGDFVWDAAAVAAADGVPLLLPNNDVVRSVYFQYSPPTRFGERYRSELESSESIDLILWANLREIHLDAAGDRVEWLDVRTLSGVGFRIEAERFVLALGGLENPRVLLASKGRFAEGVANGHDLVGRYFMEHPHYYSSAAWVMNGEPDLRFYRRYETTYEGPDGSLAGRPIRGVLALTSAIRASEGLPAFTMELVDADLSTATTGEVPPTRIASMLQNEAPTQRLVRLTCRTEQYPMADSRVTLQDDDVDALGMPRLTLDWRVGDEDRRGMRRALELVAMEMAANGLGRIWTPHENGLFTWNTQPGGHHMGTTRMSADPTTGVVDANLRCHEVSNLWLVGASVFATGGDANPTLTIVALAERLAAHLAGEEEGA